MDKKELNNFVYSIFDFVLEDLSEKNLNILEMDIDVYTVIGIYCEKNKLKIDKFKEEELKKLSSNFSRFLASFICHMEWHGQMKSKPQER